MHEALVVPTVIRNLDLSMLRERLIQKKGWTADYADRHTDGHASDGGSGGGDGGGVGGCGGGGGD